LSVLGLSARQLLRAMKFRAVTSLHTPNELESIPPIQDPEPGCRQDS
jgi:hypothetical protein